MPGSIASGAAGSGDGGQCAGQTGHMGEALDERGAGEDEEELVTIILIYRFF